MRKKERREFNFVKNFKKYIIISGTIFLIGIIGSIVFGPVLDIEFKGGTELTYSFTGEIDLATAKDAVESVVEQTVNVNESSDIAGTTHSLIVSLATNKSLSAESIDNVNAKLSETFADNEITKGNARTISPSIGTKFFLRSLYAVLIASVLIVIYVGLRFKRIGGISAGITALLSLSHDILIAYFSCVVFRLPINSNFIAVVLTLLGYSLNSTVVIYDRIRENRMLYGKKIPLIELVNKSNNQVLDRNIMTSVATCLALISVIIVAEIMGLTSLRSLMIPMFVGITAGAYSSICIAPLIWVKWQEKREAKDMKTKKA